MSGAKLASDLKRAEMMRSLIAIAVLVACMGAWAQDAMQIFIRPVDSYQAFPSTVVLDVYRQDTIATVKQRLEVSQGIPFRQQVLIFADQWLDDDQTLEFYGIDKESTVFLMLRQPAPVPVYTAPTIFLWLAALLLALAGSIRSPKKLKSAPRAPCAPCAPQS